MDEADSFRAPATVACNLSPRFNSVERIGHPARRPWPDVLQGRHQRARHRSLSCSSATAESLISRRFMPRTRACTVREFDNDEVPWPFPLQYPELSAMYHETAGKRFPCRIDSLEILLSRRSHFD